MRVFAFFLLAALSDGQLVQLFRDALKQAKCSEKDAYTDLGMDQSEFSKQMRGIEPPRFLSRIWKIQNREVAKWFFFLGLLRTGAPREVKRGVPIMFALTAQRRMARASMSTNRFIQQRKERAS